MVWVYVKYWFSLLFVRVLPLYRQRINKEGMYIIILQIIMQTT